MIMRLGALRTKSYVSPTITQSVPKSDHMTAAGVFESLFSPAFTLDTFSKSQYIAYTTKRRSERFLSNQCAHIRTTTQYSGNPQQSQRITFTSAGHVNHYCDYYRLHDHGRLAHSAGLSAAYGSGQLNVATPAIYFGNPQSDINAEYANLRPDLTVLSLPNFLLELDDVGKLFKLWKKKVGIAKNAAGAHLNYSFGWKPLFSDIREMCGLIHGVIDKIEEFEKAANQTLKVHRTISNTMLAKEGSLTYAGIHTLKWSGYVNRIKSAGLCYRPQPFQVTRDYKFMLRAYLDALGFELNPRIIWDALPFTFVLDWFFDIGSWLERHKYDSLELPFLHLDSYVQCKEDVKVTSELKMVFTDTAPSTLTVPYWSTSRQFFARVPATPTEHTFLDAGWKLPSGNQAILLTSLATVLARSR